MRNALSACVGSLHVACGCLCCMPCFVASWQDPGGLGRCCFSAWCQLLGACGLVGLLGLWACWACGPVGPVGLLGLWALRACMAVFRPADHCGRPATSPRRYTNVGSSRRTLPLLTPPTRMCCLGVGRAAPGGRMRCQQLHERGHRRGTSKCVGCVVAVSWGVGGWIGGLVWIWWLGFVGV